MNPNVPRQFGPGPNKRRTRQNPNTDLKSFSGQNVDADRPLSMFPLKVRTINILESREIRTLAEFLACSEKELMNIPNFGVASLKECCEIFREAGVDVSKFEKAVNENPSPS